MDAKIQISKEFLMTRNELNISQSRLKSSQRLQILMEIQASYEEVVSDLDLANDTILARAPREHGFYAWSEDGLCDIGDRMAS